MELEALEIGRKQRLHEIAALVAWATHRIIGAQADESWHRKFGDFRDFLKFARPPFVIEEDDEA